MKRYSLLRLILLTELVVGCTASPGLSVVSSVTPPTELTYIPPGNSASPINTPDFSEITPLPAEANSFVRLVEEDLASRLQIPADQIRVLKISDIAGQDITQGCTSENSQTTTKGRISGYRIWLEVDGKDYLYHIGLDNTIVFCSR